MKYGIIGSGPAGFTSAILAAEKGNTVVLFEKDEIGGTCLNKGCIPTKVIMHTAELYRKAKNASEIGLVADNLKIDFNGKKRRKFIKLASELSEEDFDILLAMVEQLSKRK